MPQDEPTLEFLPPPRLSNAEGNIRRAGFEMEYSGVDVERSARLVQEIFGGDHVRQSTFAHRVVNTRFGDFQVEIDTRVLKDKTYEKVLRGLGIEIESINTRWLEKALLGTFSTVVPIEIAAPPIPITDLAPLDALRRRLYAAGAKGTRASLLYAFGMHINPEIPSRDPEVLVDYLRAFLLLYPWIKKRAEVDMIGIAVGRKGKRVVSVEPAVVGVATFSGGSDGDHD